MPPRHLKTKLSFIDLALCQKPMDILEILIMFVVLAPFHDSFRFRYLILPSSHR